MFPDGRREPREPQIPVPVRSTEPERPLTAFRRIAAALNAQRSTLSEAHVHSNPPCPRTNDDSDSS